MSQGLCPSCGAAVNLTAGQTEAKCQYCDTPVTIQQAEAQFNEFKNSKIGGKFILADISLKSHGYIKALGLYDKVLEEDEKNSEAWLGRATCLLHLETDSKYFVFTKDIRGAIASYEAAIMFAKNTQAISKRMATIMATEFTIQDEASAMKDLGCGLTMEIDYKLVLINWVLTNEYLNEYLKDIILKYLLYLKRIGLVGMKTFHEKCLEGRLSEIDATLNKHYGHLVASDQNKPAESKADVESLGLPPSVVELIRKGSDHKVEAIRELRYQRLGLGLAEAKKIVEEAGAKLGTMTPSTPGKRGCFVATACYGDCDHPIVMELRHFRDAYLDTSKAGRAFVRTYYKWSPAFARFVAKNRILKTLARVLIVEPAVIIARALKRNLNS